MGQGRDVPEDVTEFFSQLPLALFDGGAVTQHLL
jgi:hypothetical protein